jgi:hypothetical protein
MDRKKSLPTATIMLYAILLTFTCLSCGFSPEAMFSDLKQAKVPIYLPEIEPTTSTQDYKVALNLGIALTDALACVYKEDQAASPRYTGMVYDYAKKLRVPDPILHKLAAINAAMEQGYWQKVVTLSEDFGSQVFDGLRKSDKKECANLTFMACELEGLYITAKSVNNRFTPESAKLLRRNYFVTNLEEDLKSLPADTKAKKEIKAITAALPRINQIINRHQNYLYTQRDAQELISICEPLRQTLLKD